VIARKSVLIMSTKIIDGGLGYLGLFFIARYMSPTDYGLVSFAMGFVTLFSIFTGLGFGSAHVKRVSEGKNLGRCIGTYLSIRAVLLILATAILFASLYIWTNIMSRGFETPEHLAAIYIIIIFWIAQQIVSTFIGTFKARKEIARIQIPFLLNGVVRTAAIVYVAISEMGPLSLAWTYVAGELVNLIMVFLFFRHYPIEKPTKEYIKSYAVFALPLMLVTTSMVIMNNIDKVMIQLFWASADVGYYFAAYRLSNFITLFTSAIGILIFPTYSALHKLGNITKIKKLTVDSERHLSLIVFPMVFGLMILAQPTAFILLSGWMPAVPMLQILPFVVLFQTLSTPYQAQFNGMDKPKINRNRILIMLVFNLTLNIIFIPKDIQMLGGIKLFGLGATGAAIATVVSFAVSLIYTRIMSYKLTGSKGNKRILLHAFAAGIMATIMYVLLYNYDFISWITRWYHLLVFAAMGLAIYLGILALFKEFTKEDLLFYMDTLNIRKMGKYIKEEFKQK
jgi:O-antigen/teichoic acid export membrane protein